MQTNDLRMGPETDPYQLLRFRDRQYAADMLAVAITKMNLFRWLADREGATSEEIEQHFQVDARPLDVLLTLCRASGLVETTGVVHRVTQLAIEHLVDSSPWFLGPYYQPIVDSPIAEGCWRVLRSGKPAAWQADDDGADWHASMLDKDFAKSFTELMNCRGMAMGQRLAVDLEPWIEDGMRVLDVGAGSGIYSSTLVARYPGLRATVLEQAPVDAIAANEIKRHGLNDKVKVLAGDMFEIEWPEADIVLLSNVLHDWDFAEIDTLIAKSAACLNRGGTVVIHEAFLDNDKRGPLAVAEYSVLLANITQGKCYTLEEYGRVLQTHGFVVGDYRPTVADRGFMTASIGDS
ncbi:MAG: methyltransferase [Planctomycetota bacterium]